MVPCSHGNSWLGSAPWDDVHSRHPDRYAKIKFIISNLTHIARVEIKKKSLIVVHANSYIFGLKGECGAVPQLKVILLSSCGNKRGSVWTESHAAGMTTNRAASL